MCHPHTHTPTHDQTALLASCRLCPRECGVDRLGGALGFCRAGAEAEIYRYGPHHGEEPPLSGTAGSGTVFFNHCTLCCLYCQNYPFSQCGGGTCYDADGFADVLAELRARGCHNWNFVTPTAWIPQIMDAVERAATTGPRLPVVYNSSGFERREVLDRLQGLVDIYLGDLRYADPDTARAGSGRADYVETAREALRVMWQHLGPLEMDAQGIARRGCIVRILVLPGHAGDAVTNLRWIADHVGTGLHVSLMSQYTPAFRAHDPPWNRGITRDEYDRAVSALHDLGFEQGWVQDFGGARTPDLLGFRMQPK